MPEGLQQGETLEPLSGFPPPSMPDDAGASHPSLRDGETLESLGQPTYPDTGDSSPIGRDTGFVHGLIRGGRNIVHAAKEFGSDLANPDMPVALSDQPEDQGSVAARLQGDTMLNKFVLKPAAQEKQRSLEEADAMHRTSGWESLGHGLTSMVHTAGEFVPVAGPLIGSLVDRAREGDISGAVGEGTTYALAPRVARGLGGKAIAAARDIPGLREVVPSVEGAGIAIGKSRVGGLLGRAIQPDASAAPGVAPLEGEYPPAETATPTFRGRLKSGQYEAPASPPPPQPRLGEGVYEGEYMEEPPAPPATIRGALPHGQYEAPASSLPSPHQLGSGTPEAARSAAPDGYAAPEPATAGTPAEYPPVTWIPRAPVTENPVVGSLVRAMQKSGVPIAERPNLLLKGSGRVNRILSPDQELTGPLEKSLRQAKRQKSANAGPLSRLR
jgi:hypothetical protein